MGENLHKPLQHLYFKYVENELNLYLVSIIDVELRWGEYALLREANPLIQPFGDMDVTLHFDIQPNNTGVGYYIAQFVSQVLIMPDVDYRTVPPSADEAEKMADLLTQVGYYIKKNSALDIYTVVAEVVETNGSTGGQVTTTISDSGQIVII